MILWQVKSSLEFHYLGAVRWEDGNTLVQTGVGQPRLAAWQPLQVELIPIPGKTLSDFPVLGGQWVCGEKAMKLIAPLIAKHVEFLPLECEAGTFYIINVTTILDCLDHDRSSFEYFPSGDLSGITHYEFKPGCVGETPIFKIPERLARVWATDVFKQLIEDHHLEGLIFRKVWEG